MAHLRWWADHIGKGGLIPNDNAELGIDKRQYVTSDNKARTLQDNQLEKITDEHIRISLQRKRP